MDAMARKLFVEVVEARNLLPKDGTGTSSPYVVADFDGQRRRTQTSSRNLNPTWNELFEFNVSSSTDITRELLEVDVLHDQRVGPSRRNNFLGRIRLDFRHFVKKGEDALIHFPLEKKSFFSWVRGDIGLRIYYDDMPVASPAPPQTPEASNPISEAKEPPADDVTTIEKSQVVEKIADPVDASMLEAEASPETGTKCENLPEQETEPPSIETDTQSPAEPRKEASAPAPPTVETGPKLLPQPPLPEPVEKSSYNLVDKMQYLFIRVVRARSLPGDTKPHVRVAANGRQAATCTARRSAFFEWDQTFALARDPASGDFNLEISVWDLPPDALGCDDDRYFLGGVCFDVSEVPVRDPPDGPLAPQWYRLEGSGASRGGDIMLATWVGTQADESFAEAWKADAASTSRSKIYLSPKLWYLRVTLIEAQETPTPTREISLLIRATLGFQVLKTRTAFPRNGAPAWNEDLLFVAAEPFNDDESLVLFLESKQGKDATILGSAAIPLSSVERRVDDRKVASRWLDLLPSPTTGSGRRLYGGRLHVIICLDGGYHVQDEQPHVASDNRPSARQLWRPSVGTIELGVIGCRGLLPMKAVDGKGTTDAFVVAKYGPKWARTRTVADSFEPAWNEQFNWPVYDPATVLTVVVFDDVSGRSKESTASCRPLGRIRIRISTLEANRSYRCVYPLLLLLPFGLKRMGEIEIAMRFTITGSQFDLLHVYSQPILPSMHHIHPIGSQQRESLRIAAARISAAHLARSEPSLRREVVMWVLEASDPPFSMRRVRANWGRIAAAMMWIGNGVRWMSEIREWRNSTATVMAHVAALLLVWFPDLIVPAVAVHLGLVGIWRYRRRPKVPAAGAAARESEADGAEREELDEEFDAVPSAKSEETVRARYERMRAVGARLQAMLGDAAAQAERVQALVSWRDPRATAVFVVGCFVVAAVMYVVPARIVAVAAAFYYMRHPVFRGRMPPPAVNFFRRLPSLADRII